MQAYLIDIFDSATAYRELCNIGVSSTGRIIMGDKLKYVIIKLKNISSTALNILKQESLSIGAELANNKDVITGKIPVSDSILFGTPVQLRIIVKKIKTQQFGLNKLGFEIEKILKLCDGSSAKGNYHALKKSGGRAIEFDGKTYIMGILNVTPDSFSDGGKYLDFDAAVKRGAEIEREGADILDIGGESTKPSAKEVSPQLEIDRICPVIEKLSRTLDIPISADTRKPEVAAEAVKAGADMINDVSGLSYDAPGMVKVLKNTGVPYIMMHSRGKSPEYMQDNLEPYDDIVFDILSYFEEKISYLESHGVNIKNIILDPGFGFAKSPEDNYNIMDRITSFKTNGLPVLAGVSKKSFVRKQTGKDLSDILSGSLAAASYFKIKGVDIVRVHDVRQTVSAFRVLDGIMAAGA